MDLAAGNGEHRGRANQLSEIDGQAKGRVEQSKRMEPAGSGATWTMQ
jgi:hypothetical protein